LGAALRLKSDGSLGVNTATIDGSAIADFVSTTKGVLLPRLDNTQQAAIVTPATGLIHINTSTNRPTYYDGATYQGLAFLTDVAAAGGQTEVFTWKYSTNTAAADPGNGNFRMNNATASLVTELYLNDLTNDVIMDISAMFAQVQGKWLIHIQQYNDATKFVQFKSLTAYTDNSGWWTLPVTYVQSGAGGPLTNLLKCTFVFVNQNAATGGGGTTYTTSAQLATDLTDETGTGFVVFNDSPTFTGNVGIGAAATVSPLEITNNGLGATAIKTTGISLVNTTPATASVIQFSPAIRLSGRGWKTTATASSGISEFIISVQPSLVGTTAVLGNLLIQYEGLGSAINTVLNLSSLGTMTIDGGLTAGGSITPGTTNYFGPGGYRQQTNLENSNFFVSANQAGSSFTTAQLMLGGAGTTWIKAGSRGSNALTPVANSSGAHLVFGQATILMAAGTHPVFANLALKPILLSTVASSTVTASATLYIEGAAANVTGATNNFALWVDAGTTRLDGKLNLGTATNYADNAAALAGGLVVGDFYRTGGAVQIVI
jgi:hypothetical protein